MTTNPSTSTHQNPIKNQRCGVKDDYDHENVEIEYVIENVLFEPRRRQEQQHHHHHQPTSDTVEYENLSDAFNSVLLNSCTCSSVSGPEGVSDVCGAYDTCPHGGNYISSHTELVLNPDRHSKDLIYECWVSCKCDSASCDNRLVQYGPRLNLEIIGSKLLHKQYSLRTNAPIPCGAFVCEYAGELLTRTEARRRMKDLDQEIWNEGDGSETMHCNKMNYVLCLNEYSLGGENVSCPTSTATASSLQQTFVDPRLRGNIGRYLNHSCQPNCEILSVRVDCPIPKIAIFAQRDIEAGEELSFHYGGGGGGGVVVALGCDNGMHPSKSDANAMQVNESTRCLCGSSNCENFLPNLEF